MSALMTSVQTHFTNLQINHCEIGDALRASLRLTDRISVPIYFNIIGTRRSALGGSAHQMTVHMDGCEERLPINPAADKVLEAFNSGQRHCWPFKD